LDHVICFRALKATCFCRCCDPQTDLLQQATTGSS
jgi:hypothetical protein